MQVVSRKVNLIDKLRQVFKQILWNLSFPHQARGHFLKPWRWIHLCVFLGRMTESWIFSLMTQDREVKTAYGKTVTFIPYWYNLITQNSPQGFFGLGFITWQKHLSQPKITWKLSKVFGRSFQAAQKSRRQPWDARVQVFQAELPVV